MANVFYLRIRGKSQGPYTLDQLRGFTKRGQLSRLHEVSTDGVTWGRASAYPELFAAGEGDGTATTLLDPLGLTPESAPHRRSAEQPSDDDSGGEYRLAPGPSQAGQAASGQGASWYYTAGAKQCGPVDLGSLQRMVASGQVGANEQVWSEGMPQWQPLGQVAALAGHVSNSGSVLNDLADATKGIRGGLLPEVDANRLGEVSVEACRAMRGTRPWILFIAIFYYVVAVLQFAYGILVLSLLNGIFGLLIVVYSLLMAAGSTLLVLCFNRYGVVLHTRRQADLEQGLHAMRRFWLYMGILLIINLSVAAIFVLVALAIGSSIIHLPMWFDIPRSR